MPAPKVFLHAIELVGAAFGETPEALDTINMDTVMRKILGLIQPKMLVIADINQPVIFLWRYADKRLYSFAFKP